MDGWGGKGNGEGKHGETIVHPMVLSCVDLFVSGVINVRTIWIMR